MMKTQRLRCGTLLCPSRLAVLEYDVESGKHSFKLSPKKARN
jgi:hypothetical protein